MTKSLRFMSSKWTIFRSSNLAYDMIWKRVILWWLNVVDIIQISYANISNEV